MINISKKNVFILKAALGGIKVNAPTFAYNTIYGKNPKSFLTGRTDSPKKLWNGLSVDAGLKDKWLNDLNGLKVEIRSSDEGKSKERPAFIIFRMPEKYDKLHKKMVKELDKNNDLYVKSDIGMSNRPRICVANKIKKGDKGWSKWWDALPKKIDSAYKNVIGNK